MSEPQFDVYRQPARPTERDIHQSQQPAKPARTKPRLRIVRTTFVLLVGMTLGVLLSLLAVHQNWILGSTAHDIPEGASETTAAWSEAGNDVKTVVMLVLPEAAGVELLSEDEKAAANLKLEAETANRLTAVMRELPPLEIKSTKPELVEVTNVGKVSTAVLGHFGKLILQIPITIKLLSRPPEGTTLELRLHGDDGSILSKEAIYEIGLEQLTPGEAEVVEVSIRWDPNSSVSSAVSYGSLKVVTK